MFQSRPGVGNGGKLPPLPVARQTSRPVTIEAGAFGDRYLPLELDSSPPVPLQVAAVFDHSLLRAHVGILFCSFYGYLGNMGLFW